MLAVAIRDRNDLFLATYFRRSPKGEIFGMRPIKDQRSEPKKWNPHWSLHKNGKIHHKSYDKKITASERQLPEPNSNFQGAFNADYFDLARHEPRASGYSCDRSDYSDVMEVQASLLSTRQGETYISVDLTGPEGAPSVNTSDGEILAQRRFDDALPWILVSVVLKPLPPV